MYLIIDEWCESTQSETLSRSIKDGLEEGTLFAFQFVDGKFVEVHCGGNTSDVPPYEDPAEEGPQDQQSTLRLSRRNIITGLLL